MNTELTWKIYRMNVYHDIPVMEESTLAAEFNVGLGQCSDLKTSKYSISTRSGGNSSLLYKNTKTEG